MESLLCPWESPSYLIFSSNVPDLLHYSHFPAIIAALVVGLYVFFKNRELLSSRLLLILFSLFSVWAVLDVIIWATNRPDIVMFLWSIIVLIEPLIYCAAFYLFYAFMYGKLPRVGITVAITALLLPLILLTPTHYNLEGIYIEYCDAVEGPLALYYSYFLEILFVAGVIFLLLKNLFQQKVREEKVKIAYFALGLIAFLAAFASGNFIGSITEDWVLAQYGLFGMPVFVGLLGYLIVHYRVFNIKVIGTQALVLTLWILIGSLLLVVKSDLSRIISSATLVLVVWFGILLVRSVKREVAQRELIQKQEQELEVVNKQQENLLHFISHEIKGYLTKSEAGFAAIAEGDYGAIPEKLKTMSTAALADVRKGVATVMDILSASNLKKGTVSFKSDVFDFRVAVKAIIAEQTPVAQTKGLKLDVQMSDGKYRMQGDEEKIREHVIRNLIDNAIRYTPAGTIHIELSDGDAKIHFSVKDSGVGITPEDMHNLFTEGGHGKDSIKINVHSTGYGLFIAKEVVEASGGKIWAESEGAGKGSRFIVELPAV